MLFNAQTPGLAALTPDEMTQHHGGAAPAAGPVVVIVQGYKLWRALRIVGGVAGAGGAAGYLVGRLTQR